MEILKLKNNLAEIRNSMHGFNSQLDTAQLDTYKHTGYYMSIYLLALSTERA